MPSWLRKQSVSLGIKDSGIRNSLGVKFCYWNLLFLRSKDSNENNAKFGSSKNLYWKIETWTNSNTTELTHKNNIFIQYYFLTNVLVVCVYFQIYFLLEHRCKNPIRID